MMKSITRRVYACGYRDIGDLKIYYETVFFFYENKLPRISFCFVADV